MFSQIFISLNLKSASKYGAMETSCAKSPVKAIVAPKANKKDSFVKKKKSQNLFQLCKIP